jgi:hypothetical protein
MKLLNCKFNNKTKQIYYNIDTNLDDIKHNIIKKFNLKVNLGDLFLTINKCKLLTNTNLHYLDTIDIIEINLKLKGGFINAILDLLNGIVKLFTDLGVMLVELSRLLLLAIEMIPLIFDPAKLIDDIMFGITYGINTAMGGVMGSIDPKKPEEEKQTSGLFDVNTKKDTSTVCISPSLSVILLLILCPPLAIFYKYSFIKAIIPSIICGVLCVKLYYFPGLLFAALMVLC